MGQLRVPITVEGRRRKVRATALVDTGASLTVIPRSMAVRLELAEFKEVSVTLADGRSQLMPISQALVHLDGRTAPSQVLIAPDGEVLLGSETLELLDVTVDPKRRKLKFGRHFALKVC